MKVYLYVQPEPVQLKVFFQISDGVSSIPMIFPAMRVGPVQPDFWSCLLCGLSRLKSEYFFKFRFEPAQSDHLPATIMIEPAQSKYSVPQFGLSRLNELAKKRGRWMEKRGGKKEGRKRQKCGKICIDSG